METQQIGNFIIYVWLAMVTLAAAIFLFHLYYKSRVLKLEKENQVISFKAAIEAEEKQKERIAQNLHDQVITILSVAGQNMQDHLFSYENESQIPDNLKKVTALINQSISDIREITLELMPKTFLDFGLIKAIELYISQLNNAGQSDTELENKSSFETEIPISKNDQITVYRICLEILNNLQKHADYSYLKVTVDNTNKLLTFTFEHDGQGITNDEIEHFRKMAKGLGLQSLDTRLMIIKAKIDYLEDVIKLNVPL